MFGPRAMTGPPPSLMSPFLRLVDRGAIGGVRHVDGDADVRIDAVGAGVGAAEADFFLHGGDGVDRHVQLLASAARRAASKLTHRPVLLSMPGELARLLRISW